MIGLPFFLLLTHHPFAGKEEKLPQIVELLAFVELGVDTLTQGFIFERAQDENGFDTPSILLEKLCSLSLPGGGL